MALQVAVNVTIPDGLKGDSIDSLCAHYNRPEQVDDGNGNLVANPETKGQFALRMAEEHLTRWLRDHYISYKKETAADTAGATAETEAETITTV